MVGQGSSVIDFSLNKKELDMVMVSNSLLVLVELLVFLHSPITVTLRSKLSELKEIPSMVGIWVNLKSSIDLMISLTELPRHSIFLSMVKELQVFPKRDLELMFSKTLLVFINNVLQEPGVAYDIRCHL